MASLRRCASLLVVIFSIYGVTGYKYKEVAPCPNIKGDPAFKPGPGAGDVRQVIATTSKTDATTDRCMLFRRGNFFITTKAKSLSVLMFKSHFEEEKGSIAETGPDGNTYRTIFLKSYGPECSNMNVVVRCSDTVGKAGNPLTVRIHTDYGTRVCKECLEKAKAYAETTLKKKLNFNLMTNTDCISVDDVCQPTIN